MLEEKAARSARVMFFTILILLLVSSEATAARSVASRLPNQSPPSIASPAAALVDARTGRVVYESNGDARRPIASLTKIATALTVLDVMTVNQTITMTAEAKGAAGQKSDLPVGVALTVRDALAYLLLPSDNDIAVALAQGVSERQETFVAAMNLKARGFGLKNTAFVDSYGLAAGLDHFSTAKDIAKLSVVALRNETIATLAASREVTVTIAGKRLVVSNRNELVGSYAGAVGLKTGHTEEAGYCLAAAARRGPASFVAVILGAPSRAVSFQEAKALLDYAFVNSRDEILIRKGEIYGRIVRGRATLTLSVGNTISREIWIPAGDLRRRITISKISREIRVRKGRILGTVRVFQGDRLLASAPLASMVDEPPPPGLLERLAGFLRNLW